MQTNRLQPPPQDIEMGHVPLRDASQPRSTDAVTANADDTLRHSTTAGRLKKRLLAAAAVGGTLLGGGLAAAVAVPLLKQQRNQALALRNEALAQLSVSQYQYSALMASSAEVDARLQAALAPAPGEWVPSDDTPGSAASGTPAAPSHDVRCLASDRPVNQTASAALMAPSGGPQPAFVGQLYHDGGPKPEDIASLNADYFGGTISSDTGIARASVLLSLAATEPAYIQDMIRPLSDTAYAVRLYDLDEASASFYAVNVRVDSSEILPDAARFKNGSPMWWSVVLQAGQELDAYLGSQPSTNLPGDSSDSAAPVRQGIASIVGAHTETIAMDELATISSLEINNGVLSNNASFAIGYHTPLTASLIQAKNDNWPAYIDRLRDKRNIGLVRLHDASDLWSIAQNTTVQAPSGASITLLGQNDAYNTDRMSIAVPGQDNVTVDAGFWSKLIVIGMQPDAAWLQPGFDYAFNNPLPAQFKPFKMPMDLLEIATEELSLTRRPCKSDEIFVQRPFSIQ